jgi:hypothetical protein
MAAVDSIGLNPKGSATARKPPLPKVQSSGMHALPQGGTAPPTGLGLDGSSPSRCFQKYQTKSSAGRQLDAARHSLPQTLRHAPASHIRLTGPGFNAELNEI